MFTLAIGNQKGGVGKTTTALNLGFAMAERGRSVLLVDLDPQASLTVSAGIDDAQGASMAEVINRSMPLGMILRKLRPDLELAPSSIELSEAELILVGKIGREMAVKKILANVGNRFDYALLDLPPSLGILTVNGLAASDSVLIPAIPQYLDLRALAIFTQTIDLVRGEINPDLKIAGVLPTFYDSRLKLHAEVLEAWELAGVNVLDQRVKRSIRFAEAPIGSDPIAAYSPEHAEVYNELAEVIENG